MGVRELEDCFDLNHSTLSQLLINIFLVVTYVVIQSYVLHYYSSMCKGKIILGQMRQMQLLQMLMIIPIIIEYIIYYDNNGQYVPLGVGYVLCETAIYTIGLLQNIVLFNFMFKFEQVKIELLIVKEFIEPDHIMLKLYQLKMRIFITFTCLFIAITTYTVSYLVCELLEVKQSKIDGEYLTDFTIIAKTIQLIIQTPLEIFFCYLTIKFCNMGIYLSQMIYGLDMPDRRTKILLYLFAVIFILHYIIEVFMYIFPYIYLYGLQTTFWEGYPSFQQFLLTYQSLTRFMKGIIMDVVIIAIVKGA